MMATDDFWRGEGIVGLVVDDLSQGGRDCLCFKERRFINLQFFVGWVDRQRKPTLDYINLRFVFYLIHIPKEWIICFA